jgi:hypothetical protein
MMKQVAACRRTRGLGCCSAMQHRCTTSSPPFALSANHSPPLGYDGLRATSPESMISDCMHYQSAQVVERWHQVTANCCHLCILAHIYIVSLFMKSGIPSGGAHTVIKYRCSNTLLFVGLDYPQIANIL